MESHKGNVSLIIKSNETNLEVRNYRKTDDNESTPVCKLHDFFSNNINLELSKVTILHLENCDLNEIPLEIRKLNLKQLVLRHNDLREVPSYLYSSLNALELLDLSYNSIKNFDIEPACSCTIVTLKLNNNRIRNLPHWILSLRCPKLTELVYSNNYICTLKASHQISIKKLEMCNCHLMDDDFLFFKSLRKLESLDISNKNVTSYYENRFKKIDQLFVRIMWKYLKVLNLSNITVSILPEGIFWITSLTELYLNNCDLSWIPLNIRYLTSLEVLDISQNTICSLPPELCNLKKLMTIKASDNKISSVPDFPHTLQTLDLYNNCLEAPPICAINAEFKDLEQNYFETEDSNDYGRRRDQLRKMFSYNRINGSKEVPVEVPYDDYCSHMSSSESEKSYENNECVIDADNWDETKPVIFSPKNPDITSSDDEWEGKEELRKDKQMIRRVEFDIEEGWIFCDVEEE